MKAKQMTDIPVNDPSHTLTSETAQTETPSITHDPAEQRAIRWQIRQLRKRLPFVARKYPRSIVPRYPNKKAASKLGQAARWLLPWERRDYPPRKKAMQELLKGRAAKDTVASYLYGKRRIPAWVSTAVADAIEQRIKDGAAIVAQLRLEARLAEQRKAFPGFRAVDPVTGLSGRSKAGHRRKTREA
jgi:hypothetical protein